MSEIYCPVCNRINNGNAERCWYCQALLQKDSPGKESPDQSALDNVASMGGAGSGAQPQVAGTEQALPAEEIPEWLARIRARKLADQGGLPIQNKPIAAGKSGGVPEWLKEMGGTDIPNLIQQPEQLDEIPDNPAISAESSPPPEVPDDHEIDWLKDLGSGQQVVIETEGGDAEFIDVAQPASAPGHSVDLGEELPVVDTDSDEQQTDAGFEFAVETDAPEELVDVKVPEEPADEFDRVPLPPQAENGELESTPSSSNDTGLNEIGLLPEPFELLGVSEETATQIPDWDVDEVPSVEMEKKQIEEEGDSPHSSGELTFSETENELGDDIPQELAALSSESGGSRSILDGIDGVLQGARSENKAGRRRDYSGGLNATKRQISQAEIFSDILKGSKTGKHLGENLSPLSTTMKVIKALLLLVLIASVILPNLMISGEVKPPTLYPAELVSTLSVIQSLPPDRPVLLVANYEAGLAGEMSLVAESVIEHLISRNIPLALLSTNAVGSAAMPELVEQAASRNGVYPLDTRLVDFGYLPGGVIAFQSLANDLRGTLPFTSDLDPVWVNPVMQNITRLADFGAIMFVSDDAEITRSWIEQVETQLENRPLLLVLSAQAAPMVQPYFTSGQVTGFVAGEAQALIYESVRSTAGTATRLFPGFQPVLILTAIAIFIGGIVSLVTYSTPQKRKEGKPDVL